jgi:hypothetical protein
MVGRPTGNAARQGGRLAQTRRLTGLAMRRRSIAWYVPFTITAVGAGASFDAFGRGTGFLYAICLAIVFVVLTWDAVRLMPVREAELRIERQSAPKRLLTLITVPVMTRGLLMVAAAVPIAVALVNTVGYYLLGGAFIVLVVMGIALLVAWLADRR